MQRSLSPQTQSRFGHKRRAALAGFTLIELLVVISIIAILAGLTFAAWPALQASIKRKQTVTMLKELEAGIDNYKIDNAVYPLNPESGEGTGARQSVPARDEMGLDGAVILYKHLSGDFDMDSQGIVDDDEKVYVEKLAYYYTERGGVERAFPFRSGFAVVDPLGTPVRYIANAPGVESADRDTLNPTYDLWSIVDGEGNDGSDEDLSRWITNWKDL